MEELDLIMVNLLKYNSDNKQCDMLLEYIYRY